MSEGFNLDIVNPEKSFLSKENVSEVVVPAYAVSYTHLTLPTTPYV